jgi:hypothetical protein
MPKSIISIKMAPVDEWTSAKKLPSRSQIQLGIEGLGGKLARAQKANLRALD